ncbi:MAG: polysaccharide pyruvyl transferase family protein [Paludibacter sp.]
MKKAAILTITDYLNYGNRLQNYAAQELLKSFDLEVVSIANVAIPERKTKLPINQRIKNALKLSPITLIQKAIGKIHDRMNLEKYQTGQKAKEKSFREYSLKYMQETDYVINRYNLPVDLGERFDYFFVGSDQVWNPNIRYGSPVDFLTFAPKNKRIALSPSFGVSAIPDEYIKRYTEWLSEMEFLSVREQAGADLIKKLTGREAQVLVDPTLMLTKEQWLAVSEAGRKKPANAYLLTYFIGVLSAKRKKILNEIAIKNGLEIVQLASLDDIERYDANPGEFVDYINSASIVCTDSFHAIIFSIQMEKPFVVFDREGKSAPMSSRIETLLSKFNFESRKYSKLQKASDIFKIDFSHIPEIIKTERAKVNNYLGLVIKTESKN